MSDAVKSGARIWPQLAGALGIGLAVGAALGAGATAMGGAQNAVQNPAARAAPGGSDGILRNLEMFADVLAHVRSQYVVPTKDDKLVEAAIDGMLQALDPHSGFLDEEDFREMREAQSGQYGGLGMEVGSENGAVKVVTPMDDSPAARAGIRPGDLIIAVDGQSVIGAPLDEAVRRMRGEQGTSVSITISRPGQDPFILDLVRQTIVLRPVSHRIQGDYAYIRISTFVNERTTDELNSAIDSIERQLGGRLKGVILDLRNNGGGLLDQAIGVTDIFMDRGEIVSTRGRNPRDTRRFDGKAGQRLRGVPMVVLINEGSASASEIVAGALQDRGRATIVGLNSFGKGSVQTVMPLGQNGQDGALRLTTARYYTPLGRSIQGAGIEPDIEISGARVTEDELRVRQTLFRGEESLRHALENDSGATRRPPHMPAEMPPETWKDGEDYVLSRAWQLLEQGLPPRRPAAAPQPKSAAAPAAPPAGR